MSLAFAGHGLGLLAINAVSEESGAPWSEIMRTADGGHRWRSVFVSRRLTINAVAWTSTHLAVAATSGGLLRSRGGLRWRLLPGRQFCTIGFPGHGPGWATSSGALWRIRRQPSQAIPVRTPTPVAGFVFQTARRGWVVGPAGIAGTTDGGRHWHV